MIIAKNNDIFLLIASAIFYAIPFILSDHFWWLIFLFPVPLLYCTRNHNLSFIHGYVWGCAVFAFHLSGGIYLISCMAGASWAVGLAMGIAMVLYQALIPAILFWCVEQIIIACAIQSLLLRLCLWVLALWLFIVWVDWYCLWIFGVQEGYPLMHPLILLVQQPVLLNLLPSIGKLLLTAFFLLVPMSIVALLWYRNFYAMLFFCIAISSWLFCCKRFDFTSMSYHSKIKSLPCMICSMSDDPGVVIKIIGNHIKKMIAQHPKIELIIMPESALNISNVEKIPTLLYLWSKKNVGKAVHIIFGASRQEGDNCYNTLHWVYDGVLQECYDKKHAMLLSERLSTWMNCESIQSIYFSEKQPIAVSCDERRKLLLSQDMIFVPYICSELFFNEWPDDVYGNEPIIAIVNDLLFVPYMQKTLVLLARFKAVQWQRDIIYVSYTQSLFIDRRGAIQPMMM